MHSIYVYFDIYQGLKIVANSCISIYTIYIYICIYVYIYIYQMTRCSFACKAVWERKVFSFIYCKWVMLQLQCAQAVSKQYVATLRFRGLYCAVLQFFVGKRTLTGLKIVNIIYSCYSCYCYCHYHHQYCTFLSWRQVSSKENAVGV